MNAWCTIVCELQAYITWDALITFWQPTNKNEIGCTRNLDGRSTWRCEVQQLVHGCSYLWNVSSIHFCVCWWTSSLINVRSSRLWNIPVFRNENIPELFESIMNGDFTFPEDDLGNVSEESCFPVFTSIYLHSLREINSNKRDWRTACGQRGGQNDSCWVSGQWVDLVKWFEKLSTFQQQIFTIIYKTGRQVKNARKVWSNIQ